METFQGFGGLDCFWTVLSGQKIFYVIPPTEKNLESFEKWSSSRAQRKTFFGDIARPVIKLVINAGESVLLPSGWIHAVYTPIDTMVIGGNFLHRFNLDMQFKVAEIEDRTEVSPLARFPFWHTLQFLFLRALTEELVAKQTALPPGVRVHEPDLMERKGVITLVHWVGDNLDKLVADLLEHDVGYYVEVLNCWLKGQQIPTHAQWLASATEPKFACVCRVQLDGPDGPGETGAVDWIGCDWCGQWFHQNCVNFQPNPDIKFFFCRACTGKVPIEYRECFYTKPSPLLGLYVDAPKAESKPGALKFTFSLKRKRPEPNADSASDTSTAQPTTAPNEIKQEAAPGTLTAPSEAEPVPKVARTEPDATSTSSPEAKLARNVANADSVLI